MTQDTCDNCNSDNLEYLANKTRCQSCGNTMPPESGINQLSGKFGL